MSKDNELERNIEYVTEVVKKHKLDYFALIGATRLKHSKLSPLGCEDAQDAIIEAEKRGLIREDIREVRGSIERVYKFTKKC
jgi:hypothetical protein